MRLRGLSLPKISSSTWYRKRERFTPGESLIIPGLKDGGQVKCTAFINAEFLPNALEVSRSTRIQYADIISRIWQKHTPPKGSVQTETHLVRLGVNINDVWIVAVAWEHGLIVATSDKMEPIREAVPDVQWDNWL